MTRGLPAIDQIIKTYKRVCGFPAPTNKDEGTDDPALSELLAYLRENWAIAEAVAELGKVGRLAAERTFMYNPQTAESSSRFIAEAREIDHRLGLVHYKLLATFGERLDDYLKNHLVMDGSTAQDTRLKLLAEARAIFLRIADFSKLQAQP